MAQPKTEVAIIIDKKEHKSPNPTTGAALYLLGSVRAGYVLFKEVPGPSDDQPIANDNTPIEVKDGDHFYSTKGELNPGND